MDLGQRKQRRKGLATKTLVNELSELKEDGIKYIETAQTLSGSHLFDSLEKGGFIREVNIHDLPVSNEALNNAESVGLKVYKITIDALTGHSDQSWAIRRKN